MERTFDSLSQPRRAPDSRCALCNRPLAATVSVALQQRLDRGKKGRLLATKTKTLCEHHAVLAYEAMYGALVAGGETGEVA